MSVLVELFRHSISLLFIKEMKDKKGRRKSEGTYLKRKRKRGI